MCFLLAVLSFAVAEEVVELEPAKALPDFNCGRFTSKGDVECQKTAFCYWRNNACIDDPCIVKSGRVLGSTSDTCENADTGAVTCSKKTYDLLNLDCVTATNDTGILCIADDIKDDKIVDYCAYAYIRDQKCPDSVCEVTSSGVGCHTPDGERAGCGFLNEKDCGLVPKCWYNSSAKVCQQDPCFVGSLDKNCATYGPGITSEGGKDLVAGDCVDFKPLKKGTDTIYSRCVYKDNKTPNICYFAGKSDDTDTSTSDNGVSYPTSRQSIGFTCSGTLTGCEGTGDCYTTLNTQGALAGLYCTDGTHGNAANILRIPSVLVFLVAVLSMLLL